MDTEDKKDINLVIVDGLVAAVVSMVMVMEDQVLGMEDHYLVH